MSLLIKVYPHTIKGEKTKYYAIEIGKNTSGKKTYIAITATFDEMLLILHKCDCTFYFERNIWQTSERTTDHVYFTCPKSGHEKIANLQRKEPPVESAS